MAQAICISLFKLTRLSSGSSQAISRPLSAPIPTQMHRSLSSGARARTRRTPLSRLPLPLLRKIMFITPIANLPIACLYQRLLLRIGSLWVLEVVLLVLRTRERIRKMVEWDSGSRRFLRLQTLVVVVLLLLASPLMINVTTRLLILVATKETWMWTWTKDSRAHSLLLFLVGVE